MQTAEGVMRVHSDGVEASSKYIRDRQVINDACNYYLRYKYTNQKKGIREVASLFNVSYYSLQRRLSKPNEVVKSVGRPRLLHSEEEKELMMFFSEVQRNGINVSRRFAEYQIKSIIARRDPGHKILKRPLSNTFWRGFLGRNSSFKYHHGVNEEKLLYQPCDSKIERAANKPQLDISSIKINYLMVQPPENPSPATLEKVMDNSDGGSLLPFENQ